MTPQPRIDGVMRDSSGRRSESESDQGRYVGSRRPAGRPRSIAVDATIRAAAPHQIARGGEGFIVEESDVMEKIREDKVGSTTLFVVDASGSMGARKRMSAAKGAVLSLLIDAYQKRDRVGLISFRGNKATLLVPPTNSIDLAKRNMDVMPTGGKTPLSDALMTAFRTFEKEIKQHPKDRMSMILISDGKGNVGMSSMRPLEEAVMIAGEIKSLNISSLVLDTEESAVSLGFAKKVADALGGRYMRLSDIESSSILDAKKGAGM